MDKYSTNVKAVTEILAKNGHSLPNESFVYSDSIGLTVVFENLLLLLEPKINFDKDNLVKFEQLTQLYELKKREGYLYSDKYMLMLTPLLRRGMHPFNHWAPFFVSKLWELDLTDIEASVALDCDRIKLDVSDSNLVELDTWFGAPFNANMSCVKDGISKLRPPLDIQPQFIRSLFKDKYSLDIKWSTKGHIKTFQAIEFSYENVLVELNGEVYHPAKYIHAEYNLQLNIFQHFDGAIHFYTNEEYLLRRDSDFNHPYKSSKLLKAKSQKVFRLDGRISKDIWQDFTSHFFTGNPLIVEYFTVTIQSM